MIQLGDHLVLRLVILHDPERVFDPAPVYIEERGPTLDEAEESVNAGLGIKSRHYHQSLDR